MIVDNPGAVLRDPHQLRLHHPEYGGPLLHPGDDGIFQI